MLSTNHISVSLAGQKVLVTGASGFIGSAICQALKKEGAIIHGVSRNSYENEAVCDYWWQCDLTDEFEVKQVMNTVRPDFIFHLASQAQGDRSLKLVPIIFRNNVMTTINLLMAATEIGCKRIILTGSFEVPNLHDGEGEVVPSSPYAASKFTSNAYGRMFHKLYQTPVVILRLFMVYGPDQKDEIKLIPYVINSFLKNQSPQLTEGNRLVDWVYIDDVVNAYLTAAIAPKITGMTFDIGSGKLTSIREVVHLLKTFTKPIIEPFFGTLPERPFEQERAANFEKGEELPGWKPMTSLADGLKNTVTWYRERLLQSSLT